MKLSKTYTASKSSWSVRFLGTVFFGVFLVAGSALFYFMTIRPFARTAASWSWSAADCTVLDSRVEGSGGTYRPVIRYRYEVNGMEYFSERFNFFEVSSSGREGKEAVVAEYPLGRIFTCFYDPSDPSQAVLDRGFSWSMLFGLFSLPFLLIGGGGVYYSLFGKEKKGITSAVGTRRIGLSIGGGEGTFPSPSGSYPQFLESKSNPMGSLIAISIFALFWNGIVSVFVVPAVMGKSVPTGVLIFMIPFILIGILLIFLVLRAILQLFNPKLTLRISPGALQLGGRGQLSWNIAGNASRVRKLTFTLLGEERATYRRGTDTTTATEKFYRKEILSITLSPQIQTGSTSFEIPADSIHTFNGRNNKIRWYLEGKGEIANWPDLEHSVDITVIAAKSGVL